MVRHVCWWAGMWIALFWLWLLIAGDWNRIEVVAAACAATVAASIGEVARARAGAAPRIPLPWVGRAWTVPGQIVVDFGIVAWALVRRRRGVLREHPFPTEEGPGVRAWAAYAANFSPNAFVVDIADGRTLVHDLVPNRSSESPA